LSFYDDDHVDVDHADMQMQMQMQIEMQDLYPFVEFLLSAIAQNLICVRKEVPEEKKVKKCSCMHHNAAYPRLPYFPFSFTCHHFAHFALTSSTTIILMDDMGEKELP